MTLDRLLNPASVAVIGASDRPGKIGNIILTNLKDGSARLFAVNPYKDYIGGLISYPTVKDLPERVDVAVIAIPADDTVEVVRECAQEGIPFVIPIASGFAEIGEAGGELQAEMVEATRGTNTRILGPNTLGILVPRHQLDTFFTPKDRSPRPGDGCISLVSQSGSVLSGVFEMAENEGVGMASCIGLGNKADLDENDLMEYLVEDPHTRSMALYLESFSDGGRFVELCSRISPVKPVVVAKVGRTARGQTAALSHTGAMASSSDAVVDGIFRQFGVSRAYDVTELLDISKGMAYLDHIPGDRIAVVSSAGGFGVLAADYIESSDRGVGMRLAEISAEGKERIIDSSVYFASAENPIDLTGGVTDEMYEMVLSILQEEEGVDAILLLIQMQTPGTTERLLDTADRWSREGSKPIVVCSIGGSYAINFLRKFEGRRIPAYSTLSRAIWVMKSLFERGSYLKRVGTSGKPPGNIKGA
ncbi:MAG: acetate--CoA ligase family protein [Methanomassiliicoccales archaeon]